MQMIALVGATAVGTWYYLRFIDPDIGGQLMMTQVQPSDIIVKREISKNSAVKREQARIAASERRGLEVGPSPDSYLTREGPRGIRRPLKHKGRTRAAVSRLRAAATRRKASGHPTSIRSLRGRR